MTNAKCQPIIDSPGVQGHPGGCRVSSQTASMAYLT